MYIALDCSFIIFWLIEQLTQFYFLFCVCVAGEGWNQHVENSGLFSGELKLIFNLFLKTEMECVLTSAQGKHLDLWIWIW